MQPLVRHRLPQEGVAKLPRIGATVEMARRGRTPGRTSLRWRATPTHARTPSPRRCPSTVRGAVGMPLCLGRWSLAPEHSSMQEGSGCSGSRSSAPRQLHTFAAAAIASRCLRAPNGPRTPDPTSGAARRRQRTPSAHEPTAALPTPEPATPPASSASAITAIPDPPPSSTRKPCSAKYLTRLRRKRVGLGVPLSGSVGPAGCRQPTRRAMPRVRSRLSRLSAILLHRGANANW